MSRDRMRADRALVERGIFESRARAQDAIRAGLVTADGRSVTRASDLIAPDAAIDASAPHPFVSRGGVKLAAALDLFRIDPNGRTCLDVGASTGGFSDVLLRKGAKRIIAIDVGRDQFHHSLRDDPRIALHEGADIRSFEPSRIEWRPDLAAIDVSFISLRLVLPSVLALLVPASEIVALIKPQFEAGRDRVGRGGIVDDPETHSSVCAGLSAFATALGARIVGVEPSPIAGGDGNREFLMGLRLQAGSAGAA